MQAVGVIGGNPGFVGGQGAGGEAGATSERLPFHAFLEGADVETIGPDFHKIHIGAFRLERRVPADGLGFRFHVDAVHPVHELHIVPRAGVQEQAVFDWCNSLHVNHFQPHSPLFSGNLLRQNFGRMLPVRGEEMIDVTIGRVDSQVVGEGNNASAPVAAHHAAGAVRVVKLHDKVVVRRLVGTRQDHETIRMVLPAQLANPGWLPIRIHPTLAPVQHHKIVPRSGERKNP